MVVANNKIKETKNAVKLTTISIAMQTRGYNAGHIARWSTSRASLEATGCRHRARACALLPRQPPLSTNLNKTHKTLTKHNFNLGLRREQKTPPRRVHTVEIVRKVPSTPNTTNPQTPPPRWCRLPLLRRGNFGYAPSNAGNLFRRGWPRAHTLGYI